MGLGLQREWRGAHGAPRKEGHCLHLGWVQWPTAGGVNQEYGQRVYISFKARAKLESSVSGDTQPKVCARKDWAKGTNIKRRDRQVGFPGWSLDYGLLL